MFSIITSLIVHVHNYVATVNLGGKNVFGEFGELQQFAKSFANFHYFHNIPYANVLQFAKVFSTKLPTVLIGQMFLQPKFLLYGYHS